MRGRRRIATSVGTDEATSQEPKPMERPKVRPTSTPMGLAEVAVSQRAEETLRLAIPQNIRKAPIRRAVPSSGLEPPDCARERTMGKRTPPRAVLLGKAGAMTASVTKMLYASPSVERPKTDTTR